MTTSPNERRKNCKRCGLENAKHGSLHSSKDGMATWCLACMRESRITANNKPQDWKAINTRRRGNTEYRKKERERSNLRDKERRKSDPDYVYTRSESNRQWKSRGDAQAKKDRANELRRIKRRERRDAMDPAVKEANRQKKLEGWKRFQRFNDYIFERKKGVPVPKVNDACLTLINLKSPDGRPAMESHERKQK